MNKILLTILIIRFVSIILPEAVYVHPDQYFQGPEVAHYIAFG